MKVLHTADWHIGSFKGPEKDGMNLRAQDTINCLNYMVDKAREEKPDLVLVSGDIFDNATIMNARGQRELRQATHIIRELSGVAGKVIVMRGTPNHDLGEVFESMKVIFDNMDDVEIITEPSVIKSDHFDIAVLPGFDRGTFRAKNPGLSKEEEHEVFTKELSNIVLGLKAQCDPDKGSILMSHYTIPGCNAESGQVMMLTQFEPILPSDTLNAAAFDLVAMGHIHRPQRLENVTNCFYSGAINAMNFNDEGQERGFWIHTFTDGSKPEYSDSEFFKTPYREFATFHFSDEDITSVNSGDIDTVAMKHWRYNGKAAGKIVRILYTCSYENKKGFTTAGLEKALYDDGAFYVKEILPEKVEETANRTELSGTRDPEENLRRYLEEKEFPEEKIQSLILKARPVIAMAEAGMSVSAASGTFEPVEIEVKNYRNYTEERFSFEGISFCTINGINGAGKSSLFMDAIVDCLYEEPREGTRNKSEAFWVRNDESARSGAIIFTFRIGEKIFRVTRTRAKSGKHTLNLSEQVNGEWVDRSHERLEKTQDEIINILGMDSLTFKSCALIMQDQYGLFLQAPKEDRMVILGNLLGLGVYEAMNKIAADKAREFGGKKRDLQQKIDIHEATIREQGDPDNEIEKKRSDLQIKAEEARTVTAERDKKNLELLSLQEAQERCNKLSEVISALTEKKAATETNRGTQAEIISNCKTVLDTEQTVIEKADRYRELEERKKELIEATALFGMKRSEVTRTSASVTSLNSELIAARTKLQAEQDRLAVYEDTSGDDDILRKAEDYQAEKERLDDLRAAFMMYQEAEQNVRMARVKQTETEKAIENLTESIIASRNFYGKDIAILADNIGCINLENANCKFLEKARAAEGELQREEEKYKSKLAVLEADLEEKKAAVARAEAERDAYAYDPAEKRNAEKLCEELFPYVAKAERVKKKAGEIALIKASIENVHSNISDIEKRLAEATTEAERTKAELEQYRGAFEENGKVTMEMDALAPWLEQEKQLPVIKERHANATQRLTELDLQITEIERELAERQTELSGELTKTTGLSEKQDEVNRLNEWLSTIEDEIKKLQMDIGALTQKMEQISRLKIEISGLQEKKMEAAEETADYDLLKIAFSQDGIPHQIIRTIVPQLESTANNILGQMTGGKTGISFKTEKVMKSNKNKEVVALDIFIEEFGKAPLPYLSKSGGEKVKASLSVILALAEIKSSSAGIQLGMLFIDEPPFLDSDGIQAYCDALETIQRRYEGIKIMAITHDPTMKARFPQNLDVVKTDQGSRVIYQ